MLTEVQPLFPREVKCLGTCIIARLEVQGTGSLVDASPGVPETGLKEAREVELKILSEYNAAYAMEGSC